MVSKFEQFKDKVFDLPILFDVARWLVMGSFYPTRSNAQKFVAANGCESFLEVGCGTGAFSDLFGEGYTGVDFFPGFIEKARERNPEVKFEVMDAMNMTFPENSFDKVLLFCFLHHMDEEQFDKVMKEAKRIAKDKVYIMELVPQKYNPVAWVLYWMDRGYNIRKFPELKRRLEEFVPVTKYHMFQSFIYRFVMVECDAKDL